MRVWVSSALVICHCFAFSVMADVQPPKEEFGLIQLQEEAKTVHIRFLNGNDILLEQDVLSGKKPEAFTPEAPEGFRFSGWDKKLKKATKNTDYQASFVPVLSKHVPYLFARDDGFLHPEDAMTRADFRKAITALAPSAARSALPELPKGTKPLTVSELKTFLKALFPEKYSVLTYQLKEKETLTRLEFVLLMNPLLGRSEEKITPTVDTIGFPDVPASHPNMQDLMEAAAVHEVGDELWSSTLFPTYAESGRIFVNGRWGIVDDNGYLIADKKLKGTLRAGKDGYYSSGNAELDSIVTNILQELQNEHPGASRSKLLRYSYNYVRDSFQYLRKAAYASGATGWEVQDALVLFTTGKGNCYNYAAAFWALARGLGYDAKTYSGMIGSASGGLTPHGWVSITLNGEKFYFDTEMEMAFLTRGSTNYESYFFKLDMATASGWAYQEPYQGA